MNEELVAAYVAYQLENYHDPSPLSIAYVSVYKWPLHAHHSMCSPDRLLNWEAFPICLIFGDRDYVGSEGPDMIIKTSKFFKTGESQLIRVPDSGHMVVSFQSEMLVEMMAGFSNGTMRGRYEEKPRELFVPYEVHKNKKYDGMGRPNL